MTSELLKKARDFEEKNKKKISPEERPVCHVTGGTGWINDPNGFSFYKGEYHLFYQYHPYSNEWGPMHWGHLKSKDMLTWERLPIIMAPDQAYDKAGCFSGSALELADGRHLIMYTGVMPVTEEDGRETTHQVQCLAFGDGTNYEKYEHNPVLCQETVPHGGIPSDFRDPKIWQDEDGIFYAVAANMAKDGNGQAVLFRSSDAVHWEYCNILDESKGRLGKMWECPDFFPLDEKYVLQVSPMAMMPEEGKFHVGHGTIACIGDYRKETCEFTRNEVWPIDWGIDFYAPQSVLTPDGRRVMIAWMQDWTNSKFVPDNVKYFGQLTVPRELAVKGEKLYQNPVRELEEHRSAPVKYENLEISEETSLEGIAGRVIDMTVSVSETESLEELCVRLACTEEYHTDIIYDPKKGTVCMDRSCSGYLYDIVHSREIPLLTKGDTCKLRFVLDRFSIELFINDGEQAATMTIFTPAEAEEICFLTKGKAKVSIEKYNLIF